MYSTEKNLYLTSRDTAILAALRHGENNLVLSAVLRIFVSRGQFSAHSARSRFHAFFADLFVIDA